MTSDHELQDQLSSRLHLLVAEPPAGRNLMPGIRKAARRRRTRVAAVSSTLGVTGVVVAGAVTTAAVRSNPVTGAAVGLAPTSSAGPASVPSSTAPARPSTVPSVGPGQSAVPAVTPTVVPAATTTPPIGVVTAPTDPAAVRAAPFYYSRTVNEQYGIRTAEATWAGQFSAGHSTVTSADGTHPFGPPVTPFTFETNYRTKLTWADFSTVPSAAELHEWMYGTPEQSRHLYGVDLTGTARGDQYAFSEGIDLITGMPTTAAFRLAVIAAVEQVRGVVLTQGVTDEVGRTGTQLALKAGGDVGAAGTTNEDIVDLNDGRLLQGTLSDADACHDGNVIWRGVYLEEGAVPNESTVVQPAVDAPTGHAASCVLPGEQAPPTAKP